MVRLHGSYPGAVRFPVHGGSGDGAMLREPKTIAITIAIARGHADGRVRWMYGLVHVSNGGAVWMVPSWRSCVFAGDGR